LTSRNRLCVFAAALALATITLHAVTDTDPFTYADGELGATSGGDWIALRTGGQVANVSSNQLAGGSTFDSPYRYNVTYASSAVYSQIVYSTTAGGAEFAVIINVSTDTDANRDYYQLNFEEVGGSYTIEIFEHVNGSGTSLDSVTGVSLANGDVLRFENQGSGVLVGLVNSTPISGLGATDTTLTDARVGFLTSSTGGERFDNWEGGDVSAGGGSGTSSRILTLGAGVN
jgi:hypothetical protein